MTESIYQVEFDGLNYMVLKGSEVIAAFEGCDEAYQAKREFETKNIPLAWQKVPPAMRVAKLQFYGRHI